MRKPAPATLAGSLGCVLALIVAFAPAGAGAQTSTSPDGTSSGSSDSTAAQATSLDPCQLVTSDEASSLANAKFSTGLERNDPGAGSRTCVYGYQTLNVFMVTAIQAPDADTANAAWSQYESQALALLQENVPPGVNISANLTDTTDVPGYDRAALGAGSISVPSHTINFGGIYLLHGATFVTYSDLLGDNSAPSPAALEAEAQTVLTRLP